MQERIEVWRRHPVMFFVAAAILTASDTDAGAGGPRHPDYQGSRFFCGNPGSERVCLPYLRSKCSLTFVHGESIPEEAQEHLLIKRNGELTPVRTPSDLSGCVRLESVQEALDYLRFFSSLRTIHLFDQPFLEIFPARKKKRSCFYTCLPAKTWDRLGLVEATGSEGDNGFEISRIAIKRDASFVAGVKVVRIVEHVSRDGRICLISEESFVFALEDIAGLMFPQYY